MKNLLHHIFKVISGNQVIEVFTLFHHMCVVFLSGNQVIEVFHTFMHMFVVSISGNQVFGVFHTFFSHVCGLHLW